MEVDKKVVLNMIYTFLEDNGYGFALETLQKESNFAYIIPKIKSGEWESVLHIISSIRLSPQLLYELYEQIVFELVEEDDGKIGLILLQQPIAQKLKETHEDGMKKLESLCSSSISSGRSNAVNMQIIYDQEEKGGRQERRERLARMFRESLRLFDEDNEQFGLFKLLAIGHHDEDSEEIGLERVRKNPKKGKAIMEEIEDLTQVKIRKPYEVLSVIEKAQENIENDREIECINLCPNTKFLVVGFIDGNIEVWNKYTLDLIKEGHFEFQKDKFMGHSCHVLYLEFNGPKFITYAEDGNEESEEQKKSNSGKVLASGDSKGSIKVWNFFKGKLIKKIENAHIGNGITCIRFNENTSIVYSSSFDKIIKAHGLKTGELLKEFKGHSGPISDFHLIEDEDRMISSSGDGTLRMWNIISAICVKIINPFSLNKAEEDLIDVSIISCHLYPDQTDKETKNWCLICHEGSNISMLINIKTNSLISSYYNDKQNTTYINSYFDEDGKYVMNLCSDNYLYVFETKSAKLIAMIEYTGSKETHKNIFTKLINLQY